MIAGFQVPRAAVWLVVQGHTFWRARADPVAGDEAASRPERHHVLEAEDQVTAVGVLAQFAVDLQPQDQALGLRDFVCGEDVGA